MSLADFKRLYPAPTRESRSADLAWSLTRFRPGVIWRPASTEHHADIFAQAHGASDLAWFSVVRLDGGDRCQVIAGITARQQHAALIEAAKVSEFIPSDAIFTLSRPADVSVIVYGVGADAVTYAERALAKQIKRVAELMSEGGDPLYSPPPGFDEIELAKLPPYARPTHRVTDDALDAVASAAGLPKVQPDKPAGR